MSRSTTFATAAAELVDLFFTYNRGGAASKTMKFFHE